MAARLSIAAWSLPLVLAAGPALAQSLFTAPRTASAATNVATAARDAASVATADARSGLRVTKGSGVLPNEHGQIWREYDLSPYTAAVKDHDHPQQAVVDWILRETGTDVWFSEPLGILSANQTTLRVYHTPDMHDRVREIVERLVSSAGEPHVLGLRLVTVGSPNWRARAVSMLKPIDVKSPGVEGWLLSRENAAMLYEELKARSDVREHSAPQVQIVAGQSRTLARTQPVRYQRGVQPRPDGLGYELIPGQIDEGYSLRISPLLSLDRQSVEAAITCEVDQVEKLVPIVLDVPVAGQGPRVQIQVPQLVSWRLSERLRWPADQVLLVSCGVVANPAADAGGPLSLVRPFGANKSRADALLLMEYRPAPPASLPGTTP